MRYLQFPLPLLELLECAGWSRSMVERAPGDVRAVPCNGRVGVELAGLGPLGGVDVRLHSPTRPDARGWWTGSSRSRTCATTRKLSINVCPLTLSKAILLLLLFLTPLKSVKLNFCYCNLKDYLHNQRNNEYWKPFEYIK